MGSFRVEEYHVTDETRRLWQTELDMADVLLCICRQFNLKIWACFGTLLGAARHKGFIPWDDDLDFVMMRPDYDKLVTLCRQGKVNAFLPTNYSFDSEDISVLKLRRSDTTAIHPQKKWGKNVNNGVWIDVFCLDVAPDDVQSVKKEFVKLNTEERLYRNRKIAFYAMVASPSYVIRHALIRLYFVFRSCEGLRNSIENRLRNCEDRFSGDKIWPYLCWSLAKSIDKVPIYSSSWFDKTVMLPFEDRCFPCPAGWEQLLVEQYGDWQIPVMGGSLHEGAEIDLNNPYDRIISERLSKMPLWKRYAHLH